MDWILFALLCAFFTATGSALSKLAMKENDEYIVGWIKIVISAPFLLGLLFFIEIPKLDYLFWRTVMIMLPLEATAYILYMKAIKKSPLSLTIPFVALTPVFSILFGYLILGERVTSMGAMGILCVTLGAYLLNADLVHLGILEPIKAIYREPGSRYMIMVAFIYSITSAMGKFAIIRSSTLFFPAIYLPIFALMMAPLIFGRLKLKLSRLSFSRGQVFLYILLALTFVLGSLFHFFAISKANVAYMISVKRMSVLISVIYGKIVFKELRTGSRFIASLLMVLGVVLIVLAK